MDELFNQEELHFEPLEGDFDVEKVAEAIAGIGFSFRDEELPEVFVMTPDEESRDIFREARLENPDGGFPYVLLITVEPRGIVVNQTAGGVYLDLSRQFVEWLVKAYRCKVSNESETDLSAALAG